MRKILITSTQYPYYGGAATNAYALIKYFRKYGIKTAGIFFDNHSTLIDPDKIGGIWRINKNSSRKTIKKIITRYLRGEPDIILGKNYSAPVQSKNLFPNIKVVYLVTGSPQMILLSSKNISAIKYLKKKNKEVFKPEINCIKKSNIVIPNSLLGRKLLIKHYGNLEKIKKPIDTSMALNRRGNLLNFKKRKYDIAFVASNLERTVKNSNLAIEIFKKFRGLKKVVIGKNNSKFRSIPNTKVFNLIQHSKVIDVLSNSRLVLCTSFYDASPNVIKEAISCNANILLSRNCGWSEIYPKEFVCKDVYNKKEWETKIQRLTSNNINFDIKKYKSEDNIIKKLKRYIK